MNENGINLACHTLFSIPRYFLVVVFCAQKQDTQENQSNCVNDFSTANLSSNIFSFICRRRCHSRSFVLFVYRRFVVVAQPSSLRASLFASFIRLLCFAFGQWLWIDAFFPVAQIFLHFFVIFLLANAS